MANEMKVEIKGKTLVVEIPLEDPIKDSKSGKTLLVASSHGNQKTAATVKGEPLWVGLTAYVKKK